MKQTILVAGLACIPAVPAYPQDYRYGDPQTLAKPSYWPYAGRNFPAKELPLRPAGHNQGYCDE